jgi:AraC-like DNA-binding protein
MPCVQPVSDRLRPFVKGLWIAEGGAEVHSEHVLPSGDMHLAIRFRGPEVRLCRDETDAVGEALGRAVVGGPRSRFYVKRAGGNACSAGVILRPDAALPLFGIPPCELAEHHARLSDLIGSAAGELVEQVQSAHSPERILCSLEAFLTARLPVGRAIHPAVASALAGIRAGEPIEAAVRSSGCSHRRFVGLFRRTLGLAPVTYRRLQRFRRAVDGLSNADSLARLAFDCGFSDQAHLSREFREMAGVTPDQYRRLAPPEPNHIPAVLR